MKVGFEKSSIVIFCLCYLYDAVLVHIEIGNKSFPVKGRTLSVSQKTIYHFSKIPYAKPPIGNRRFRYPEELGIPPWPGTYDSNAQTPTCWQGNPYTDFDIYNPTGNMWFSKTKMSEDCLYLTIWTPEINVLSQPLPVMIWIYGGSYMTGSNTLEVYDGSFLASFHNVVIVTFQFRIGPLGFLFMDNEESPGNQALMDQRMALKWVNMHIKTFGGNPNLVTLFGESSGATSISLHLFSPMTNKLFHKAILQSGTIFAPWAIESPASALSKGNYLADFANCSRSTNRQTIKCLRNISPENLVQFNYQIRAQLGEMRKQRLLDQGYKDFYSDVAFFFDIYFRPIIDQKLISKRELQKITEGKLPTDKDLLIGTNTNEAMFFLTYGLSYFKFFNSSNVNLPLKMNYPSRGHIDPYRILLENILDLEYLYPSLAMLILYEYNIKSTRLDDESWTAKNILEKLDLIGGDTQFICPTVQFADSVTKNLFTKLYMYNFNSRTSQLPAPDWLGVMHGYEIEYVFGMPFSKDFSNLYYKFTKEEKETSKIMMEMWTNFAKWGNPTPTPTKGNLVWPIYNTKNKQYLKISSAKDNGFTIEKRFKDKKCKFWTKILPELRDNLLKKSNGCSALWNDGVLNFWITRIATSVYVLHLAISH